MNEDLRQYEDFLKTITVIYVEDDAETRAQLSQFLRRRVGALLTADSGSAGLEVFRTQPAQMVITDILMPGMDGLTMAQEIRKLDPNVPIIVTTAFEQTEYLVRSIDVGVDKYVTKPIVADKMLTALLQVARHLKAEDTVRRLSAMLQQSQKLESLGIVAVGMAHDFDIMAMSLERALACAEPCSELHMNLQLASNSCERAARLGRALLDLAKEPCPHDSRSSLVPLIRENLAKALVGTDVVLECMLEESLPQVAFNSEQMNTVFAQLAANARNAMPSGGTLRVSGERCAVVDNNPLPLSDGEYLHIRVSDTGVGIAPQDLPRIFDPYWSSNPMGSQNGMGLGLTLCYSIITKHRGFIAAESEPGCGASFHLYLPLAV